MPLIIDHFRSARADAVQANDCLIYVTPVEGGWSVHADILAAPLMFLSGAKAEEEARGLAERLAVTGRDAKVLVHDRAGAMVGSWRYFADGPRAGLGPWLRPANANIAASSSS